MADVNIDINVVAKQALSSLRSIESQNKKATSSFGSLAKSVVVFNQGFQLIKGFANAAKGAISAVVGKAIEMEKVETQFKVFTKSASKSKALLEDLQQFAATTPFQLPGLAEASKTLLAFGSTSEEVIPRLKFLGDAAAATGKDISDLTLIFGQVQAAGKLTGERLLQLQERSVNLLPVLSKQLGVTEAAVKKMVSAGKIDFATFEKALKSMSEEGGLFFEGMIKQSKTLGGVISTVGDNFDQIATDVGKGFLPALKQGGLAIISFLQANRDLIKSKALEFISIGIDAIGKSLQFFIRAKAFAVAAFNGLQNVFLSSIQAVNGVVEGYIRAKIAIKNLVGANVEAEQKELRLLEIRKQVAEELKKENENEAIIAIEKSERQSISIEEEFAKIQEANTAKEDENARHNEEVGKQNTASTEKGVAEATNLFQQKKNNILKFANFEKLSNKDRISAQASTFGRLQQMADSNGKVLKGIGQAASLAQIGISTAEGAVKAYTSLAGIPVVGPALGFAAAGAIIAFGAEQAGLAKGFEDGGIVGGSSFTGDRIPALVNSGELILNRAQQDSVAGGLTGGDIIINIEAGVVADNDALIDQINDGLNRGREFRNLQLKGAA